jgi:hypothetical protein
MPASSGPLLDRIDIHIEVPRVEYEKLSDDRLGEPSAAIQTRVEAARQRQRERFSVGAKHSPEGDQVDAGVTGANASPVQSNADMRPAEVRQFCALDETSRSLMRTAMSQLCAGARLSPPPQAGAHDCGFSGERNYPAGPPGRGAAVSAEGNDGVNILFFWQERDASSDERLSNNFYSFPFQAGLHQIH